MDRLEAPLDYRSIWNRLHVELKEMAADLAQRAVTERDLTRVPRHQGAFEFVQAVQAKMDDLVAEARSGSGNGRYAAEDDA